jgi:hypothetical protein
VCDTIPEGEPGKEFKAAVAKASAMSKPGALFLALIVCLLGTANAGHLPGRGSGSLLALRRPVREGRASRRAMLERRNEPELEPGAKAADNEAATGRQAAMSSACLVSTMTASVGTCI